MLAALVLSACGQPTPIAVYVTPTPQLDPTTIPVTVPGDPPATSVVDALVQVLQTPTPTATTAPGVFFGPIVGTDYTPEPLHTPVPSEIAERPCPAIVQASEVNLYADPDAESEIIGTAVARERLPVSALTTDEVGEEWANTPGGWLRLLADGRPQAALDSMRACDVLRGTQPDTTLAGLHVLNDTGADEVIALVERLAESGHPLGTIKGLNGTEGLLAEVKRISPETVTVYRSVLTPGGLADCPAVLWEHAPEDLPEPESVAREWLAGLEPEWDKVDADYYEVMHECPATMDWLARFSIEAMKIAAGQDRCLLLFSFPGGNPALEVFDQLLPAYEYALENPCASGRNHGIALHAYGVLDTDLVSESDVWMTFRHRIFYERLLHVLPEAADLPVYITEMGMGGGTLMPSCETIVRDALQYTYQLEEDPYVKGFHLWNVGTGEQWYDITPCLPLLGDALLDYYQS